MANMLPVSLVESTEFRARLAFLEPAYKPCCRQTLTMQIKAWAAMRRKTLQQEMESDATAVAVTADVWTSLANDPCISLTANYITPPWMM